MAYCGVAWIPIGENIRHALPWLPPLSPEYEGGVYLPFLNLKKGGIRFDYSERSLLFACLINYPCDAPSLVPDVNQPYLLEVLLCLVDRFDMSGLEKLCLEAAAVIRHDFGCRLSCLALHTGMTLLPDASTIKSDYLLDTWCRLQVGDPKNRSELALKVIEVFPNIIKEDILPGGWQGCLLTYIVSLAILSRWADAEAVYATHREAFEEPEEQEKLEWMLNHRKIDMKRLAQPSLACRE